MTIGSAAFLPGRGPEAPLAFFHDFPPQGSPSELRPQSRGVPPGRSPAALAPDDLPCGRILLVADQAVFALDLQRMLRDAGYRVVGPACSVVEARQLIERGAIDCAILDINRDGRTAFAVGDLLATSGVPFLLLTDGPPEALPDRLAGRPVVEKPYTRADLLAAIRQALASRDSDDGEIRYPIAPATVSWPRVMPQL
jgi:CheY-like chemotaxis protein